MRYIRTKDGIYKTHNYCLEHKLNKQAFIKRYSKENEIFKLADTIEELCDEFVIYQKGFLTPEISGVSLEEISSWYGENNEHRERVIHGAIWTNRGLIYIAKMNDKGELELL